MSTDSSGGLLAGLVRLAIRERVLVLLLVLGLAALAGWSASRLPIDATPDITNVQVQVNTGAAGYSPLEVEQRITWPVETVLAGLPHLDHTRSLSRYGLSQVTVVFEDGTDLHFARQLVAERLAEARTQLPEGLEPSLGPPTTGLGEVFTYSLTARPGARKADGTPWTAADLRTLNDWVVRPRLRLVPGVTEVNTMGGAVRQIHVTPDPARLATLGFTLEDVAAAVLADNRDQGAGYIEHNGQQWLVRVPGQVADKAGVADIVVGQRDGIPVRVRDLGQVVEGSPLATGSATEDGQPAVLGTVSMLVGANSRDVARASAQRLAETAAGLPDGVEARAVYDRTNLVARTIRTVARNLAEGALLVIVVLFLMLGNVRAALLTAAVIPLSMLFTLAGMARGGVSANLMSLGALDFGLIVDGAVIIVENCMRRFSEARERLGRELDRDERSELTVTATVEVIRPSLFGMAIIAAAYLPVFALSGIEGRMFHPMAITVVLALTAAMMLSLTFVPAAVAMSLGHGGSHRAGLLMDRLRRAYLPLLDWTLRRDTWVFAGALLLVVASIMGALRLGREFIPTLDEGDIALHALRIPGTGLAQSEAMQQVLETALLEVPEVGHVFSKIGTPEVATDPMPPSVADTFVMLKARREWPDPRKPRGQVLAAVRAAAEAVPGNAYEFTQPIQMRFNELISGVRADVGVKVFGPDLDVLRGLAGKVEDLTRRVPGAADVRVEQVTGLPVLTVLPDRPVLARLGISVRNVQDTVAAAIGGAPAGTLYEGDRRFGIVVRLPEHVRNDPDALGRLPIALPGAPAAGTPGTIPLREVARIERIAAPNQIQRENGSRRVVVTANVEGRDLGRFVGELSSRIEDGLSLPTGYWIEYGGTFEQMVSAGRRLAVVAPLTLGLVVALLYLALRSWRDALIVSTGVPLALTGGVAMLLLRGMPLSITAGVGFVALAGIAVLNGLVMVTAIRGLEREGMDLARAIREGAARRVRPVLMTALVASLGFVPMALNTGTGAEVQRPLATVVIGGIVSSTLLTLLVLPGLYGRVGGRSRPED